MSLLLEVDLASSVPVFEQIRLQVVAHVAAGRLTPGDHLPTIRALATDLGVRHAATALGLPAEPKLLAARAEAWRPWRSYATLHLWSALEPAPRRPSPTPTASTKDGQP